MCRKTVSWVRIPLAPPARQSRLVLRCGDRSKIRPFSRIFLAREIPQPIKKGLREARRTEFSPNFSTPRIGLVRHFPANRALNGEAVCIPLAQPSGTGRLSRPSLWKGNSYRIGDGKRAPEHSSANCSRALLAHVSVRATHQGATGGRRGVPESHWRGPGCRDSDRERTWQMVES